MCGETTQVGDARDVPRSRTDSDGRICTSSTDTVEEWERCREGMRTVEAQDRCERTGHVDEGRVEMR